jgi:hypothetical protein
METQANREKIKNENTPNPKKEDPPQYGRYFCYEENISMEWGKPQHTE